MSQAPKENPPASARRPTEQSRLLEHPDPPAVGRQKPSRPRGPDPIWTPRFFLGFQALFWFIAAAALFYMLSAFLPLKDRGTIVACRITTGIVITWFLHKFYQSPFILRQKSLHIWIWAVALMVAASVISAALWLPMIHELGLPDIPSDHKFAGLTISRIFNLIIWHSMYFGINTVLKSHTLKLDLARSREDLKAAELRHLQSQLNPHFLFNSLNTIKAKLHDVELTGTAIQNLADYLRFSLQEARPLEPLSRELNSLELYLHLQGLRFGRDLECLIEVTPTAMNSMIPPMLIQPLVENAFKFGPRSSPKPLRLEIRASTTTDTLVLRVSNSGCWVVPSTDTRSQGIGLLNLRRRLHILLGEKASLSFEKSPQFITAVVIVPLNQPNAEPGFNSF